MTTVQSRLNYWRGRNDYLGDMVTASLINYKDGGTSVSVELTIYTESRGHAIERLEKWIVPDATVSDYLTKTAYKKTFTLSNTVSYIMLRSRRRWFRW